MQSETQEDTKNAEVKPDQPDTDMAVDAKTEAPADTTTDVGAESSTGSPTDF